MVQFPEENVKVKTPLKVKFLFADLFLEIKRDKT